MGSGGPAVRPRFLYSGPEGNEKLLLSKTESAGEGKRHRLAVGLKVERD